MTVPHKLAFNYLNNNIRLEYISTSSGTFIIRIWYSIYAIEKGLWDECTVKDNPIASFPSTKLYLDVGRLLFSSFFFTSPRLSSYFLYFIKMSFHHINESQKKNNGSSP